jgi:hypothetical protein
VATNWQQLNEILPFPIDIRDLEIRLFAGIADNVVLGSYPPVALSRR